MTIPELIEALEAARVRLGPDVAELIDVRMGADWDRIERVEHATTDRGSYVILRGRP